RPAHHTRLRIRDRGESCSRKRVETGLFQQPVNAQQQAEPSKAGIDGGTITKLDVYKDNKLAMRFDQEWQLQPKTPEQKEALHRIRNGLDDTPQKDFKGFDRKDDKDRGFDR
ncbi:DUF7678 domain-containing protein, partial [Roseivivax lentus]|uniref:DUF7678 domain-containing protein n=1 Tax=Roseivivax lentus TaxID=633194 RepID=UPI0013563616